MIASTQTNHPLASYTSPAQGSSPMEVACERLRSAGLRITQPRIAIINALLQRTAPATIEQIHSQLNQSTCDLVTVYRCLSAFQKAGLVRLSYFHNGTSLYQLALNDGEASFHVVERSSRQSSPLDPALAEELRQVLKRIESELKNKGFRNIESVVNFLADLETPPQDSRSSETAPASRTEAPAFPVL